MSLGAKRDPGRINVKWAQRCDLQVQSVLVNDAETTG